MSKEASDPVQKEKKKSHRLFLDDTVYSSFVRRLAWSPDGTFMLTPSSWYQDLSLGGNEPFQYTVYGFMKTSVNKPSFMLPGIKTPANCIRFCPLLMKLREDPKGPALIDLPYRMVFAVATYETVLIYDTQSTCPVALIKNLHYDSINDMVWINTNILMVASSDGYCSFIKIENPGEKLEISSEEMPENLKEYYQKLSEVNFQKNMESAYEKSK